jgi:hypothetical protein
MITALLLPCSCFHSEHLTHLTLPRVTSRHLQQSTLLRRTFLPDD